MTYTPLDIETLARTVFGEARGESYAGKVAVAWSVINRVLLDLHRDGKPDWWGEGVTDVCRKPWQYSCWNATDPNLKKLKGVTEEDQFFRACLSSAAAVLSGIAPDNTEGATHYHTLDMTPPDWAAKANETARIGNHVFYKDVP